MNLILTDYNFLKEVTTEPIRTDSVEHHTYKHGEIGHRCEGQGSHSCSDYDVVEHRIPTRRRIRARRIKNAQNGSQAFAKISQATGRLGLHDGTGQRTC